MHIFLYSYGVGERYIAEIQIRHGGAHHTIARSAEHESGYDAENEAVDKLAGALKKLVEG